MSIEIQPLALSRLDEALQVWEATLGEDFKPDRSDVAERLQNGGCVFLIAVDDETGCVIGVKFGYFEGRACIWHGIGVLPAYRRRWIATRLIRRFEQELRAHPEIEVYAFGSGTSEGIPFHIAMGYLPQALIQFTDRELRPSLYLSGLNINRDGYNEQHQVYQIFAALDSSQSNLETLRLLQAQYPQVNIQFFFEKVLS